MSSEVHEIGATVTTRIQNGSETYTGTGCVQSWRELWEGRFRYGFYCLDDEDSANLKAGLQTLSGLLG